MSITQFKNTSYVSLDESAPVALPLGVPGGAGRAQARTTAAGAGCDWMAPCEVVLT